MCRRDPNLRGRPACAGPVHSNRSHRFERLAALRYFRMIRIENLALSGRRVPQLDPKGRRLDLVLGNSTLSVRQFVHHVRESSPRDPLALLTIPADPVKRASPESYLAKLLASGVKSK